MEEILKDIEGYEGKYQVSNYGRIKSLSRVADCEFRPRVIRERIVKTYPDGKGYLMAWLYKNKKRHTVKVHRIVANAFIPNVENKEQIDHINTIRTDNRVSNLRWVTPSENSLNPISLERNIAHIQGGKNGNSRKVIQLTLSGAFVRRWDCINDAVRSLGVKGHSHIVQCCKGERNHAHGYKWQYA